MLLFFGGKFLEFFNILLFYGIKSTKRWKNLTPTPLIGPMLLLFFENVSAYALIQDYALIRTLKVNLSDRKILKCTHCVSCTYSFYWCTGRYNYYAFWNENKEIGKASLEPQLQYLPKSKNVRICCKMKDFQVPFKLLESSNNLRVLKIFKVLALYHLFGVRQGKPCNELNSRNIFILWQSLKCYNEKAFKWEKNSSWVFLIEKLITFIILPLKWIEGNQQQFMPHMEWFPKVWFQPTFFLSWWIQFVFTCLKISEVSSRVSQYYLKSHRFSLIWHMKVKQDSCKIETFFKIYLVQKLRFYWTIRFCNSFTSSTEPSCSPWPILDASTSAVI